RHEAGLDQPRLRVDADGGAGRALRRPLVLRQGEVPAPEQRGHQDGRRRQQPGQADARLSLVQAGALAEGDPGDGEERPEVRAGSALPARHQLHHRGVPAEEAEGPGLVGVAVLLAVASAASPAPPASPSPVAPSPAASPSPAPSPSPLVTAGLANLPAAQAAALDAA